MGYSYLTEKAEIFTEDGQVMFLRIRDHARKLLEVSGAVTGGKLLAAGGTGSSWTMMACVDRLCELGELRKVYDGSWWQHSVYVAVEK